MSNINKRQKELQEMRTSEAIKKKMMGVSGKLGTIVKWLGSPIVKQGGGFCDSSYLEDILELPDENEIPEMEDEDVVWEGFVFDGLRMGMHIEIKYMQLEETLTCEYKGYRVYTEVAGELYSYAPFPEWENSIDKLYREAIKKREKVNQQEEIVEAQEIKAEKFNIIQKLRLRWGI